MPGAALVLRIQDGWVRVPAHKELLLSMWKQALTIKRANTPEGCSRGMSTERGKAAPGLQQVLKKESITYLSAALSTHTWGRGSSTLPGSCSRCRWCPDPIYLSPASMSVRQLSLYSKTCPGSAGGHSLEMPGIFCPSHQWPTVHLWRIIYGTEGCPLASRKEHPNITHTPELLVESGWGETSAELTLWFVSFPFLWAELKGFAQSFG